ncbi:hypothetical protein BC831DRAFT_459188 [Entophlyctis helioformis]|nr:hypothetical protein BC831DRAFT_459188 [Entophlyctis helioformis]
MLSLCEALDVLDVLVRLPHAPMDGDSDGDDDRAAGCIAGHSAGLSIGHSIGLSAAGHAANGLGTFHQRHNQRQYHQHQQHNQQQQHNHHQVLSSTSSPSSSSSRPSSYPGAGNPHSHPSSLMGPRPSATATATSTPTPTSIHTPIGCTPARLMLPDASACVRPTAPAAAPLPACSQTCSLPQSQSQSSSRIESLTNAMLRDDSSLSPPSSPAEPSCGMFANEAAKWCTARGAAASGILRRSLPTPTPAHKPSAPRYVLQPHVCAACCHRGSLLPPAQSAMTLTRATLLLSSRRHELSLALSQRIAVDEARLRLAHKSHAPSVSSVTNAIAPDALTAAQDRLQRLRAKKDAVLSAIRLFRPRSAASASSSSASSSDRSVASSANLKSQSQPPSSAKEHVPLVVASASAFQPSSTVPASATSDTNSNQQSLAPKQPGHAASRATAQPKTKSNSNSNNAFLYTKIQQIHSKQTMQHHIVPFPIVNRFCPRRIPSKR